MGLKLMEKCPMEPSLRRTGNSMFFHLLAMRGRFEGGFKFLPVRSVHPIHQAVPDQLFFLIARFVAALVGIADEASGIQH